MTYVYGISAYYKDSGFSGVGIFKVFPTVEMACAEVDSYIQGNAGSWSPPPPMLSESVKFFLERDEYAVYREGKPDEENTMVYSIVKLRLCE